MVRDDAYLLDILLMAKDAREFTTRHTRESFHADRESQYAVIRCLEVIGEVSKRLSPGDDQAVQFGRMVGNGTDAGHAHPFIREGRS